MTQPKPQDQEKVEPVVILEKITKKNGEILEKKWLKGDILGKGGFATCYEMKDLDKNKLYAVKVVAKSSLTKKRALEKILAEIKIHKSLNHPNIVSFEHVFEDKDSVYILLEICPNQTLKELLKAKKRLSEMDTAMYTYQTIKALQYLHSQKIIHRDLKLGNLLLGSQMEIKVADFGLAAKIENNERRHTICGTPNYLAPEVLDKKTGHSYEVDTWSLGVICYTLLVGRPPFETSDTKTTYRKILKADYSFPSNVKLSDNAKDLVKKVLVVQPENRLTFEQILAHPFVKAYTDKHVDPSEKAKRSSLPVDKNTLAVPQANQRDGSAVSKDIDENEVQLSSMAKSDKKRLSFDGKPDLHNLSSPTMKALAARANLRMRPNYDVYVTNWVDYTAKYGLGYMLSDGTVGVVFNDKSRITVPCNEPRFEYTKRCPDLNREVLLAFKTEEYPQELNKKMLLVDYFKEYLRKEGGANTENKGDANEANRRGLPLVYVKKWERSKHATIFRLSNKVVQVVFDDKTQIVLSPIEQVLTYRNKVGEVSKHALDKIGEIESPELSKRLGYTKGILAYIENKANKENHNQLRLPEGEPKPTINIIASPVMIES